jgi:hypothetical protein
MSDPIHAAEHGDLRPQVNPSAFLLRLAGKIPAELKQAEPILIDRFFQLARPIADVSKGATPEMRIQDAGRFIYLIEALTRLGCTQIETLLCTILDEFLQLDERSYDELYLWCIVELSRRDSKHVQTYWPQVLALDAQYRSAPWERPEGVHLVDQPYRLTDLVFYYYVLYTPPQPFYYDLITRQYVQPSSPPSLGSCLQRILHELDSGQFEMATRALEELAAAEPQRVAFGDALGLLNRGPRGKGA